jgi:hypothetical protein
MIIIIFINKLFYHRMSRVDVKLLHLNLPLNVTDTVLTEELNPLQDNLQDPVL